MTLNFVAKLFVCYIFYGEPVVFYGNDFPVHPGTSGQASQQGHGDEINLKKSFHRVKYSMVDLLI